MKQQPPYAKALLNDRRQGRHPWKVLITFSSKWIRHDKPNRIHIPLDEYEPDKYSFKCVAGVATQIKIFDSDHWPLVARLVYEVSQVSAPVTVVCQYEIDYWRDLYEYDLAEFHRTGKGDKPDPAAYDPDLLGEAEIDGADLLWAAGQPRLFQSDPEFPPDVVSLYNPVFQDGYERKKKRLWLDWLSAHPQREAVNA